MSIKPRKIIVEVDNNKEKHDERAEFDSRDEIDSVKVDVNEVRENKFRKNH